MHPQRCQILLRAALAGVLLSLAMPSIAQWTFLGAPLISPQSVSSQSLALSTGWHPHLAYTSGGNVAIDWFDGWQWTPVGTSGIPTQTFNDCALAFDAANVAHLALAPNLGVYRLVGSAWQLVPGLPSPSNAQGLQLRIGTGSKLWLAWFKAGATDTTYVYARPANGNWSAVAVMEGRVLDMELDDIGEPLLLLANAQSLTHRVGGIWQPTPMFTAPGESHFAFEMVHDGSGEGAIVARRDTSNGITVELLGFGTWQQLGTAGFATGEIADLGLSRSGTPMLVSVDFANNGPPRAYQYVAGNWQHLGGQTVYNNKVSQPQWAFDPGASYLVFRDDEEGQRNSVMYLGTPNGEPGLLTASPIQVWPNPVHSSLHFQVPVGAVAVQVRLLDAMGRERWSGTADGLQDHSLDVDDWPPGVYFVLVEQRGKPLQRSQFLKLD